MIRLLMLLSVAASCFFAARPTAAQDSPTIPLRVFYVKRTATHITSGGSYTATYGPYATHAEALQVKNQLDQNRWSGTWGYGIAYIQSAINPAITASHNRLARTRASQLNSAKFKKKPKFKKSP